MPFPSKGNVHCIGIGGIGLSSLAQWFHVSGWHMSGSDIAESEIVRMLQKRGIRVRIGHRAQNLPTNTECVIYSSAVLNTNPELKKARRDGIRALSYPQALGELTRAYKTVAIAGS